MYSRKHVFSHVGRLSLLGFGEMSEAMHETGTSPDEKAEQEEKRLQSIYTAMLRVLIGIQLNTLNMAVCH